MSKTVFDANVLGAKTYDISGRFNCFSVYSDGVIKLFTGEQSIGLSVNSQYVNRIRDIASRDKGSLYVEIKNNKALIYDEPL